MIVQELEVSADWHKVVELLFVICKVYIIKQPKIGDKIDYRSVLRAVVMRIHSKMAKIQEIALETLAVIMISSENEKDVNCFVEENVSKNVFDLLTDKIQ